MKKEKLVKKLEAFLEKEEVMLEVMKRAEGKKLFYLFEMYSENYEERSNLLTDLTCSHDGKISRIRYRPKKGPERYHG